MACYSTSRISTFEGCPLRYKYQYQTKFSRYPEDNNKWANRGLSFHETVEHYYTGCNKEENRKLLDENIKKFEVDLNEFDVVSAYENFLVFWDYFVVPLEKEGFTIRKEYKMFGNLSSPKDKEYSFMGIADLLCESNDKVVIFDYKVKKAESAASYKNQLLLYAFLVGKQKGWTLRQIAEKVELNIFYSLMPFDKENPEKGMLKCMRKLDYNFEDLEKCIKEHFVGLIDDIENCDFSQIGPFDGKYSFACNFCPYAGSQPNPEIGYEGCRTSILNGFQMDPKYSIIKR